MLAAIEGEPVELEEETPLFMPLEPVEPAPGLKPVNSEGRYPQPTESEIEVSETYEAVVDKITEEQEPEETIESSNSAEAVVEWKSVPTQKKEEKAKPAKQPKLTEREKENYVRPPLDDAMKNTVAQRALNRMKEMKEPVEQPRR